MDKSKITSDYKDSINSSNTKHLMLNWSESEIGHRHPDLPLGYVLRDQFQFDLFSGKSRLLLDGTGIILAMADYVTLKSKYTQITTQDITSFTINSKNINPKLFHTDYVLSMSDSTLSISDSILSITDSILSISDSTLSMSDSILSISDSMLSMSDSMLSMSDSILSITY